MMRVAEKEPLEQVLCKSPFSSPCQAFPFFFSCQGAFINCEYQAPIVEFQLMTTSDSFKQKKRALTF